MIRFEDVSKVYSRGSNRVEALKEVNLEVLRGEFITIEGPSGSGKSTLLNLMGGIDRPSQGSVLFEGVSIGDLSDEELSRLRRDKVGIIYQSYNLLPALTVRENVALPLLLKGLKGREVEGRVEEQLKKLSLEGRARHLPAELSGGEMQRVAIARAVVHKPQVILADEPTGNLDSAMGLEVLSALNDLKGEGYTVVLATHSQEAQSFSDRLFHLRDGRLSEG
ncbi:MAG: ABC transporter ATP-binding protein [Nitrospinota bacterium]